MELIPRYGRDPVSARVLWTAVDAVHGPAVLDTRSRLEIEQAFVWLKLSFALSAILLLLDYGWRAGFAAGIIMAVVLLDCSISELLIRTLPSYVVRLQILLRLADVGAAYVVLQCVHRLVGGASYDSVYLLFVVAATATHGSIGALLMSCAAAVAVIVGRLQLVFGGTVPFDTREVTDGVFYLLLFLATGLTVVLLMKKSVRVLYHRAFHDPLTELPNRALLHDRLQQLILRSQRTGGPLSVMVLDLDGFKEINDTFGHRHGDLVLQEVARRLRSVIRASDTVARLGGDEFAVVLPDMSKDEARTVAERIEAAVSASLTVEHVETSVGVSVGMAMAPEDGHDTTLLLQAADRAMYDTKREGQGSPTWITAGTSSG